MMDNLRWLLDNVPEDSIEEHALEIEETISQNAALKRENEAYKKALRYLAVIKGHWCIYPDKEIEHVSASVVRYVAGNTLLEDTQEQEDEFCPACDAGVGHCTGPHKGEVMISPKLLTHNDGKLYAFRGQNQIAWRFGRQIKVCQVTHLFGPVYRRTSQDFFECIDAFSKPKATP